MRKKEIMWPGTRKNMRKDKLIYKVNKKGKKKWSSKWVEIVIGGIEVRLYYDTWSHLTLIAP